MNTNSGAWANLGKIAKADDPDVGGVRGALPLTCCTSPRITIVKRWSVGSDFYTIERCRRCGKWWRRKQRMVEKNGQITDETFVTPLKEIITGTQDMVDKTQ